MINHRKVLCSLLLVMLIACLPSNESLHTLIPRAEATNIPSGPVIVPKDILNRFRAEGHDISDIYTAQDLEDKTGVKVQEWLALRKSGMSWPQAIATLWGGKPLHKRRITPNGYSLPEDVIYNLLKFNHPADVIEASNIIYDYGGNVDQLLARKVAGESWESIRAQLDREWRESRYPSFPSVKLPERGPLTISPDRLRELLAGGHSLHDIWVALDLAFRTQVPLEWWLNWRMAENSWFSIIRGIVGNTPIPRHSPSPYARGLTTNEMQSLLDEGHESWDILYAADLAWLYGTPPENVFERLKIGNDLLGIRAQEEVSWYAKATTYSSRLSHFYFQPDATVLTTPSGLHKWDIQDLVDKGFSTQDILHADAVVSMYGLTLKYFAEKAQPNISLVETVERIRRETPTSTLFNKGRDQLALSLGLTVDELFSVPEIPLPRGSRGSCNTVAPPGGTVIVLD